MTRRCIFVGLMALALPTAGCSTVAKQAYYGVRGAQGEYYELKGIESGALAGYQSVRVAPFKTDLGDYLPVDVITAMAEEVPRAIESAHLFFPDGKRLTIEGTVIHYTDGSFGGQECVCRVRMLDGDSGALLGEAVCFGVIKSAVRQGAEQLAVGVGEGIVEWIEEVLPEDDLERRREALAPPE